MLPKRLAKSTHQFLHILYGNSKVQPKMSIVGLFYKIYTTKWNNKKTIMSLLGSSSKVILSPFSYIVDKNHFGFVATTYFFIVPSHALS